MKTEQELQAEFAAANPDTDFGDGRGRVSHGDPEFDAWFSDGQSRWVSARLADQIDAAKKNNRKIWPNAAAFLAEFQMPELAAIELSADGTVAALRLLLASWPSDVWSDDPRIELGLGQLVAVGIIDEARRAAILTK